MKQISVIIVNYNVQEFLEQTLLSLDKALLDTTSEIIVVDNASIDGSVKMVRKRFPNVQLIESPKNLGFSAGNNLGIKEAQGQYIVLLNPDTVVQEDTFQKLLDFFARTPAASAATCKILNPDGSFSVDCRHSVPTPLTAFWKLLGLDRLFPKSKVFAKYNLTYLDENELNQVEAISGSFMMLRSETVAEVGLLDEDFFMYCEDIDYCHRINQAGGKIFYVPDSQIIHYKGESTKKNNLDYVITFNRSLYTFYKKHYQQKYITPFKWLILFGVIFRGTVIYTKNLLRRYFPLIVDLSLLNLVMVLSFYIRFELKYGFKIDEFLTQYSMVNLITSALFFFSALFFGTSDTSRFSVRKTILANLSTFVSVAALTFFLRQFAYSRLVVLISAIIGTVLMLSWRVVLRYLSRKNSPGDSFFSKRTLVVGTEAESLQLIAKLKEQLDSGIRITGIVTVDRKEVGQSFAGNTVVTSLDQLDEYLRIRKTDLVIFPTHNISYETILSAMSRMNRQDIEFKIVPNHLEYMISKSSVERFQDVSLVDIDYNYGKPFNRFTKRMFDFILSLLLLVPISIMAIFSLIFQSKKIQHRIIRPDSPYQRKIFYVKQGGILKLFFNLYEIFRGNISFVGAPLDGPTTDKIKLDYKPGLFGVIQSDQNKHSEPTGIRREYQYLKNHSMILDIEILLKSLFKS